MIVLNNYQFNENDLRCLILFLAYGIGGIVGLIHSSGIINMVVAIALLVRAILFGTKWFLMWFSVRKTTMSHLVSPYITITHIVLNVLLYFLDIALLASIITAVIVDRNDAPGFVFFSIILISLPYLFLFGYFINTCTIPNESDINILTYNIQRGHNLEGIYDIQKTYETIKDLAADVVCMQEITPICLAELKNLFKGAYPYYVNGTEGNSELAILSKYKIQNIVRVPGFVDIAQDRGIIAVQLMTNNGLKWVITTHWSADALGNLQVLSSKKMVHFISQLDNPIVVCGDFNSVPGSVAIDYLIHENLIDSWSTKVLPWAMGFTTFSGPLSESKIGRLLPTYYFRLDHIFSRQMKTREITVNSSKASDHKPLSAILCKN